jgi:uncharacterized membrane protein
MGKGRVEAFSDGVFTIAATLLVLAVPIPHPADGGLSNALLSLWPSYLAYAISFIVIGNLWVSHHELFHMLHGMDRPLMYANLILLMFIAFIPFPTAVLAGAIVQDTNLHVAAAMYAIVMTGMSVSLGTIWALASRRGLLLPGALSDQSVINRMRQWFGLTVWVVSIPLSFVNGYVCMALWIVVMVFYIVVGAGRVAVGESHRATS